MAFPQGIDFRGTSGFVVDPANCTFELGAGGTGDYPTVTPQGNTVGWVLPASAAGAVDRDNTLDPRLAGMNFWNPGVVITQDFRVDLPSAGTYLINAAVGDTGAQGPYSAAIYDGATTLLQTIANNGSNGAQQWFDATGTFRTSAADWVTANPQGGGGTGQVSLTFATTQCLFRVSSSATSPGRLNHIWIQAAPTALTSVVCSGIGGLESAATDITGVGQRTIWWRTN